jgi:hypothetical protein
MSNPSVQLHREESNGTGRKPMRVRISFVGKRIPVNVIVEDNAITLDFPQGKNGDVAKDGGPLIVLTDKDKN